MPSAELTLSIKGFKEGAKEIAGLGKASEEADKKINNASKSSNKLKKDTNDLKDSSDKLKDFGAGFKDFFKEGAMAFGVAATTAKIAFEASQKLNAGSSHYKEVDFANAVEKQSALEETATRLSFRTGEKMKNILGTAQETSQEIGETQDVILKSVSSFVALTHSTKDAANVMYVMGDAADSSGRKIEEILPVAVSVGNAFGNTSEDIDSSFVAMENISKAAGNLGGLIAFQDTIASLGPQLEQLGVKTEESRNKILAFVATAGKDFKPKEAGQISSNLIDKLKQNSFHISRELGHDILDKKTGKLTDPIQTLKELQSYAFKHRGGKGSNRALWALRQYLGNEGGSFLANANFKEIEKLSQEAKKAPIPTEQKKWFSGTQSGLRNEYDISHENEILSGRAKLNLVKRDINQSKIKNMSEQIDKEIGTSVIPGLGKGFEFLDTHVDLAEVAQHTRDPNVMSMIRQKTADFNSSVIGSKAGPKITTNPEAIYDYYHPGEYEEEQKENSEKRRSALIKEHPKEAQQLANSMSKLQAVVKNGIIEGLKGANLYVKTPILPPTNPSPGNQNPPSQ